MVTTKGVLVLEPLLESSTDSLRKISACWHAYGIVLNYQLMDITAYTTRVVVYEIFSAVPATLPEDPTEELDAQFPQ